MADGADATGKLSKLARLKSLKSGLKAQENAKADDSEDLSLDAMLLGDEPAPEPVVKAPKPSAAQPKAPPPQPDVDKDGESLSSYFEALGIVPDNAKTGATGKAPESYSAPSDAYTRPEPKPEPGRDVDERDLWADPVRNDDTFLSSFAAGETVEPKPEKEPEEEMPSLDSIIGSFDDEETAVPEPIVEDEPVVEPEPVAELEAIIQSVPEPEPEPEVEIEPALADLDKEVDIEAFEAEIALKDSEIIEDTEIPLDPVVAEVSEPEKVEADKPLTITFDESRATLLSHVSKQMSCSIDDVVVTAIDWYLDALFGEEDPDVAANQGD